MQAEVKRSGEVEEFETEERCSILEMANDSADENVSIARVKVKPGVTTAWHKLAATAERYVLVAGHGRVELGDLEPVSVGAGDVVRIPADMAQRIKNTGETDLIFFAICSPRFRQRCYVALE